MKKVQARLYINEDVLIQVKHLLLDERKTISKYLTELILEDMKKRKDKKNE